MRGTELRIVGLIAVAIAAYWSTSSALWHCWTDDFYFGGHDGFVAVLAVWLLYRARNRVASAPVQGLPWGLALLVPCSIASLIFWKAGIQSLQLLMLPALVLLTVLTAFGSAVTRAIAVPVGFLYFAMPAWNVLQGPLQSLTLSIVRLLAPAIGVPATVSGSLISLPDNMSFTVDLQCSGLGFLVEGLAVAALLGELEQAPVARRLRLLGSMALISLVTNWIRVLTIVQVGYSTRMRHVLVTRHHLLFGYVLFVLVLALFVWIATRHASPNTPQTAARALASPSQAPSVYVAALVALAGAPVFVGILGLLTENHAKTRELRLPAGRAEWRGPLESTNETWRPVFVGPHDERRSTYQDPSGRVVEAVAIGYQTQAYRGGLVNEDNSLVGNGGLTLLMAALVEEDERHYREDVVVDKHGLQSVIWSFYDIEGRTFVAPKLAQLWYGVRALRTPPYAALFAFRAACSPSCDEARRALGNFVRAMRPQFLSECNTCRQFPLRRFVLLTRPDGPEFPSGVH